MTATILVVTVVMKFREGGWVTVLITGSLVVVCLLVHRHYSSVGLLIKRADDVLTTLPRYRPPRSPGAAEGGAGQPEHPHGGLPRLGVQRPRHPLAPAGPEVLSAYFKNAVFLSVGVVDSASFKGSGEIENLKRETERDLNKYVEFARGLGMHAEHHFRIGTDLLDEIVALCHEVKEKYDRPIFFASKLIFPNENLVNRATPQPDSVRRPAPPPVRGAADRHPSDPGQRLSAGYGCRLARPLVTSCFGASPRPHGGRTRLRPRHRRPDHGPTAFSMATLGEIGMARGHPVDTRVPPATPSRVSASARRWSGLPVSSPGRRSAHSGSARRRRSSS